eukprot:Tamp_11514.p3 GENE.Tamp_11514~~Tamp_11514.p3  ORF type:complete len:127 (-),score=16.62 Tamp_11514:1161-1541(-)
MPTANIDTLTKDALPKKKIALKEERTLLKTKGRSFIQHNKCSTSEREREGEGGREREREREGERGAHREREGASRAKEQGNLRLAPRGKATSRLSNDRQGARQPAQVRESEERERDRSQNAWYKGV